MTEGFPDTETVKAFNTTIADEFRANGGKVAGQFEGADLLLLTTTGAKSRQQRLSPLAYFTIDGRLIIIGSFAGAPKDLAWVHNLRTTPAGVHRGRHRRQRRDIARTAARRTRGDPAQGHRHGAGVRRIPVEDQPGHSAVRVAARLTLALPRPPALR